MSLKLEKVEPPRTTTAYDTDYSLFNYSDFYYVGNLYMGDGLNQLRVIWDTGSEWLVITSYLCETCSSWYDYDYSGEASWTRLTTELDERNYGSVSTQGFYATDTVCLGENSSACVEDFDIFMITWQEGMPSYAGAISGLATDSDNTPGPNLIKSLRSSGVITEATFSFYLER